VQAPARTADRASRAAQQLNALLAGRSTSHSPHTGVRGAKVAADRERATGKHRERRCPARGAVAPAPTVELREIDAMLQRTSGRCSCIGRSARTHSALTSEGCREAHGGLPSSAAPPEVPREQETEGVGAFCEVQAIDLTRPGP
jgi:hypothetical protein